jgi:FtsZ-interacting cell division protein ZipA
MTKENRFEGLMGVVGKNKNAQTSKPRNDSDLKSESQAEVHSAQSDVQKSSNNKKSSSRTNVQSSKSSNISTSNKPNIQASTTQADNSNSAEQRGLGENPHERLLQENVPASKHTDVQPSKKAKSVNPDYTRTTVYLPKKMHKKLKAIALDEEREMSSILEELIETWLSSRK